PGGRRERRACLPGSRCRLASRCAYRPVPGTGTVGRVSATDHQSGREALGARLRELRSEAGLQGKELADQLGWQRSKVSRLENGKQTATAADLRAWAQALGVPAESADLLSRLRGLESRQRSWRRQLATGHRAVQDRYVAAHRRT